MRPGYMISMMAFFFSAILLPDRRLSLPTHRPYGVPRQSVVLSSSHSGTLVLVARILGKVSIQEGIFSMQEWPSMSMISSR
jgi:hypothetical protein